MSRKMLDQYPTSWGTQRASVFVHTGPASYVQLVVAAPPTGGDPVTAREAGMKFLDNLVGDLSDDGQFRVECVASNGNNPTTTSGAMPALTFLLRWIVVATGVEVAAAVNLSGRTVRLQAIGPK